MTETSNPHEKVFVNPDHSSQVLYQLSELWRDKKLCDATIEVGPVKVYVHRLVLLAACPYLLTIGGQHDVPVLEVKLPMSVGLEGLNVFLTYLYDGTLHVTTSNLVSVEKISKILKVSGIKKFCQEFRDVNESVLSKDGVGSCDKFSTDYGLKMTDNSIQIIFSEISSNDSASSNSPSLKRENVNAVDSLESDNKRRRMNIESLSPALQHQNTPTRFQTLVCSDQSNSVRFSKSSQGDSSNDLHTTGLSADLPSLEQRISIKQEPKDLSEEDHNNEVFVAPSGDSDNSLSTDFIRRVPYNTQTFPSIDEDIGTSSSHSLHAPHCSTSVLADSEVNNPSTFTKYDSSVTYLPEYSQSGKSTEGADLQRVLKNAVQSLAVDNKDASQDDTSEKMRNMVTTQCEDCGRKFSSILCLKRHIAKAHGGISKYVCEVCGLDFTSKNHLQGHQSQDHGCNKRFKCDLCGKEFNQLKNLKYHKEKFVCQHGKIKNKYRCDNCGKEFGSEKAVKQHTLVHNMPHLSCDVCGKSFKMRTSVCKHKIKMHS